MSRIKVSAMFSFICLGLVVPSRLLLYFTPLVSLVSLGAATICRYSPALCLRTLCLRFTSARLNSSNACTLFMTANTDTNISFPAEEDYRIF